MTTTSAIGRTTKYVVAVRDTLRELGHASNAQILAAVQQQYPEVSITTIHRVTSRLRERELIGSAPKMSDGSERYDINPDPHHHFLCNVCDRVCDVPESDKTHQVIEQVKELSGECALAGTLTLGGVCKGCKGEK